jgi:hypothetical protein
MIQEPVEFASLKEDWKHSRLTEVDVFLYTVDPSRGDRFFVMLPSDVVRLVSVRSAIVNNAHNVRGSHWKAACLPGDEVIALQRENDEKYVQCERLRYSHH